MRSYLAQFGLEADKALTEISKLSGGEKVRLVFAKISLSKPHLLILDEPTNHLDLKGREALIAALNQYAGSVILITHDFHILQCVCDTLWIVQNKTCQKFDGDLEDYRALLLDERPQAAAKAPKESTAAPKPKEKKMSKSTLTVKIKQVETALDELNRAQEDIQTQMASGEAGLDYAALNRRLKDIQQSIAEQERLWYSYTE